eukprot:CAMPEP_0185835564 /NCGR_PEP_ID=MMETSP1353-20130828/8046_1 /TAXON_ID=1077150 /ORGANISM="Erythrolobus australicus, Strain CCMP3124" /LENGTH=97 /DNA_ID=CAMNT_0028534223 /DNA_START=60 /DNA_END=350 /DNA_ORIENTATION=+
MAIVTFSSDLDFDKNTESYALYHPYLFAPWEQQPEVDSAVLERTEAIDPHLLDIHTCAQNTRTPAREVHRPEANRFEPLQASTQHAAFKASKHTVDE